MDWGAWWVIVHGAVRVRHDLATKPIPPPIYKHFKTILPKLLLIIKVLSKVSAFFESFCHQNIWLRKNSQSTAGILVSCVVTELTSYMICYCCCIAVQSCLTLCDPMTCSCRLLCPWNFPSRNTGVGCISSSSGSFWPLGVKPVSCLAGGFFTTELPEKPFRYGLGSFIFICF